MTRDQPFHLGRDGIRLQRVELLNWGTFHQRVAVLHVNGGNCLLTGQIGSGKSTIVDAVSIVMNPPSQITFNQAAGASRRERTLTSYVLGAYRNVSDEATGMARPDHLRRAAGTQSVILTVYGDGTGRRITIGVLLRFQNEATSPKVQYLVADRDLSIEAHFTGHPDARQLRAALKADGVEIFDQYQQYSKALGRRLRLSKLALGLFNQTVSMKSVSNLNEFVRTHMLEAADVTGAVDKMLAHYADLTRAHDLVVDARWQREALDRVADESDRLDSARARIAAVDQAIEGVPVLVDTHRRHLLTAAIAEGSATLPVLVSRRDELAGQLRALRGQETELAVRLRSQGGSDLALAERDVTDATARVEEVVTARRTLDELAAAAGIAPPADTADFPRFLAALDQARAQIDHDTSGVQQRLGAAVGALTAAKSAVADNDTQIRDATTRSSNIPSQLSDLRDRMAEALDLPEGSLMFAGELLAVADEHEEWRGAVERLLRPFATSLLVPAAHHEQVTEWVDRTHLGRKLVMYRVDTPASRPDRPAPGSVAATLVVRPGAAATAWLTAEVAHRYDHVRVADPRELTRHRRALSLAGQVKDSHRQEKDDSRRIDDQLGWVLGWNTRDRLAALEAARPALLRVVSDAEAELDAASADDRQLRARQGALTTLADRFGDPAHVDVVAAREAQARAEAHLHALRSNPEIAALARQREAVVEQINALEESHLTVAGEVGATEQALHAHQRELDALVVPDLGLGDDALRILERARADAGPAPTGLSAILDWARLLRDKVDGHATSARLHHSTVEQALVSAMGAYGARWPARVVDLDTTRVSGCPELLELRARLVADDLPKYEKDFRDKLQSNAINEIAMFARTLDTEAGAIRERIDTINAALADIDYQPGTRIRLTVDPTKDQQVRDFRADLKAITTGMVGAGDGAYNEAKFIAVRELLDRFRGRDSHADEDARWMRRVTDVRNWHTFAATELSRDEDTLVEHYSDSDGKSGGQKEKLAYTILAASLAYQFGLAEGETQGFRFVMIDEAFGRGSEESTRYGLDLFERLGLQLLVVTPLQKISTIEPYVQAVGYIGRSDAVSRLRSMTIEEYRQLRAQRALASLADVGAP